MRHIDETTIALESRTLMVMVALAGVSEPKLLICSTSTRSIATSTRSIEILPMSGSRSGPISFGAGIATIRAERSQRHSPPRSTRNTGNAWRASTFSATISILTVLWSPARGPADKAGKLYLTFDGQNDSMELDEEALKQLKDKSSA